MVLVDTSVWVDHFRGKETPQTTYLSQAVAQADELCISGIVLTEVLQGLLDEKEYHDTRTSLDSLIFLPMLHQSYLVAADIYRQAKQRGQTIRGSIDCLIAACAITHNARLLQNDKDFSTIAKFSKLKLVEIN